MEKLSNEQINKYFAGLRFKPKFYSYKLDIKSLSKTRKIVSVVLLLSIGFLFTLIGLLVHVDNDIILNLVFGFMGIACLLWGLYNWYIIKGKD